MRDYNLCKCKLSIKLTIPYKVAGAATNWKKCLQQTISLINNKGNTYARKQILNDKWHKDTHKQIN
jgi:hypothetical protein